MRRIAIIAAAGALAAPGTAVAQDTGYGSTAGVTTTPSASAKHELPFTGLDVVPMLAAGAVLVGAGIGLARTARDRGQQS